MPERRKYMKRAGSRVVAVRLDLETEGLVYHKWGETQTGKRGDWIVDNDGDTYTVDHDEFQRTYRRVSPGMYEKVAPVWVEVAPVAGVIRTREGLSHYSAGAYLVYDDVSGEDGYPVEPAAFEKMYEPAP